jgi:predicted DNA-binding transcriptional regulator YafY
MLLQTRGRMSATELSRHFEVSVRTIHRDIDQLSAAGIPVYGDRGRSGGFQLMDGFRTKLTGLTQLEAETLLLAGLPGPIEELGLGDLLFTAHLKLLASLPAGMRAERVAARFHLDTAAWFRTTESAAHLRTIARAVWEERILRIQYRRSGEIRVRDIRPLGLVLKSGVWYLVAARGERQLTYRAANIVEAEVLDQPFERPADFDLASYWTKAASQYEAGMFRETASIRISPRGRELLELMGLLVAERAKNTSGPPDEAGWIRCDIPIESIEFGVRDILRLGADAEVLAPFALRKALKQTLGQLVQTYKLESSRHSARQGLDTSRRVKRTSYVEPSEGLAQCRRARLQGR